MSDQHLTLPFPIPDLPNILVMLRQVVSGLTATTVLQLSVDFHYSFTIIGVDFHYSFTII